MAENIDFADIFKVGAIKIHKPIDYSINIDIENALNKEEIEEKNKENKKNLQINKKNLYCCGVEYKNYEANNCVICGDNLTYSSIISIKPFGYNLSTIYMPLSIYGNDSKKYKAILVKNNVNSRMNHKNFTLKTLVQKIELNKNNDISKQILSTTLEYYNECKKFVTKSSNVNKISLIVACLWIACNNMKVYRTYKEICAIFNTKVKNMNNGLQFLKKLMIQSKLTFDIDKINGEEHYMEKYITFFNIDKRYTSFVYDLLKKINEMYVDVNIFDNTKYASILLLISKSLSQNIDIDMLENKFNIKKTTIIKYYNILNKNYEYIKPVFKKHKIPMDKSWQTS